MWHTAKQVVWYCGARRREMGIPQRPQPPPRPPRPTPFAACLESLNHLQPSSPVTTQTARQTCMQRAAGPAPHDAAVASQYTAMYLRVCVCTCNRRRSAAASAKGLPMAISKEGVGLAVGFRWNDSRKLDAGHWTAVALHCWAATCSDEAADFSCDF